MLIKSKKSTLMDGRLLMRCKQISVVVIIFLLASCQAPQTSQTVNAPPSVEYLTDEGWPFPFSKAVRIGNMLYLSGEIGLDPTTYELVPGGIVPETKQAMENIRSTLEKYGSSINKVVKCTIMIADIGEWNDMNGVYASYFTEHFPVRSSFGANGLALGARVEIECGQQSNKEKPAIPVDAGFNRSLFNCHYSIFDCYLPLVQLDLSIL